jgi:hypothetical protein
LSGRVGLSNCRLRVPSWSPSAKPASIANLSRNRVIWKSRAKDASAHILPKGHCPPAETTLEVRA